LERLGQRRPDSYNQLIAAPLAFRFSRGGDRGHICPRIGIGMDGD
jgi:hypothetical protein